MLPPDYRILATVPYQERYQHEREWTLMLRKTCDLLNISVGAAPLKRGPETPEHKAKISVALLERKRRGSAMPGTVAA